MAEARVKLGALRERPGFNESGDLVQYVDIPFTIVGTGAQGLVSVPANQFSTELAQRLVRDKADSIIALYEAFPAE